MYEYRCKLIKVIDGDTVDVTVDLGFKIFHNMRIRLFGIDAHEMREEGGPEAKAFVENWFGLAFDPVIVTQKDKADSFGRYLGTFHDGGSWSDSLNDALINEGHAVRYTR